MVYSVELSWLVDAFPFPQMPFLYSSTLKPLYSTEKVQKSLESVLIVMELVRESASGGKD